MKEEVYRLNTTQANKSLKDLKKELKEAKSDLLNLTEGTEEYTEALEKAAQAEQTLRDMSETVTLKSKGLEGATQALSAGLAGVAGATNAVIGTMSLLGVENEELQKKLNDSITALIGITQGLQAIDPAVKGFKDFNTIIKASTSGMNKFKLALIGTGLGALVVVLGSIIANWDEFSQTIGISSDVMEKFGDITKRTIRAAGTVIKNFTQGITQSVAGVVNALKKVVKGDFSGAFDELKKGFKNAGQEFKEIFTETISEWGTELPPEAKEASANAGKTIGKTVGESMAESAAEAFINKIENWNAEIKIGARVDAGELADAVTEGNKLAETLGNINVQEEKQTKRKKKTEGYWKDMQTNIQRTTNKMGEYAKYVGVASDVMASLEGAFEKGSAAQKAFAITSIISDTAAAIMSTWYQVMKDETIPTVYAKIAMGAATSLSMAITGALQVANIAKNKIDAGSVSGASMTPQVATTAIQESNWQGQDYQVYVLESDITETQNRVRVIEQQSKF